MSDYTILTGDCVEAMRAMGDASVDAVVTDPPYGTQGGEQGGYGRRELWFGTQGRTIRNDDDLSAMAAALPEIVRVVKPDAWLVFFASPRKPLEPRALLAEHGLDLYGEVVWDKRMPSLGHPLRYVHETALICRLGNPPIPTEALLSLYSERAPFRTRRAHPHEKPLGLMRMLVRFCCPPGGSVLDPFAGSGTTGVAALLEKRDAVLIEIDDNWATYAGDRLRSMDPERDPLSLFHTPLAHNRR